MWSWSEKERVGLKMMIDVRDWDLEAPLSLQSSLLRPFEHQVAEESVRSTH